MNATPEIVEQIRGAGGSFRVHAGKLRVTAPVTALTPEVKAELRERRQEVIAWHNERARDELGAFFKSEILPRLTALSEGGLLPPMAACAAWRAVEGLWDTCSGDSVQPCDIEGTKKAMLQVIEIYTTKGRANHDSKSDRQT